MTQTLDVQMQRPVPVPGPKTASGGKTGAETARNGSSFLAIIEKMVAGTMEGKGDNPGLSALKTAGRGAGDEKKVPGDDNTLIKPGDGAKTTLAVAKKDVKTSKQTGGIPTKANLLSGNGTQEADAPNPSGAKTENGGGLHGTENRARTGLPAKTGTEADSAPTEVSAGKKETAESGAEKTERSDGTLLALIRNASAAPAPQTATSGTVPAGGKDTGSDAIDGKPESVPSRKDRKSQISVRDERTDGTNATTGENRLAIPAETTSQNTVDMTIGFRSEGTSQSTAGESLRFSDRKDSEGQNFSTMLSQELKNNAADFVKTGQIVLKNNNEGLIRLTLHPESLGNVNISLELSGDHKISGKIIVSSQEAYDAFNENLEGLSDAFVQGGFESAGFDLSWSGSGNGSGGREDDSRSAAISPYYASAIPDVMSGAETADIRKGGYGRESLSAVNVFA